MGTSPTPIYGHCLYAEVYTLQMFPWRCGMFKVHIRNDTVVQNVFRKCACSTESLQISRLLRRLSSVTKQMAPDVIHVIGVPRPFPFFAALPLPCIILNANRRTKTGEAWERGYYSYT